MTAKPLSAPGANPTFPLPTDFGRTFLHLLAPDDQALIEDILPPWRATIEWMYDHGELTNCSLGLFRDMLPLREEILRRRDMPWNLREAIQQALSSACQRTGLTRRELVNHWNSFIVPTCLAPWIDELSNVKQWERL
jgi:hypothetical protein